jgi:excisionase family DNA binding protein
MAALNDPDGRWFDYAGAAEYLGVKKRWVKRAVANGKLPYQKRGRLVRIERRDLDALIEAQRRAG